MHCVGTRVIELLEDDRFEDELEVLELEDDLLEDELEVLELEDDLLEDELGELVAVVGATTMELVRREKGAVSKQLSSAVREML